MWLLSPYSLFSSICAIQMINILLCLTFETLSSSTTFTKTVNTTGNSYAALCGSKGVLLYSFFVLCHAFIRESYVCQCHLNTYKHYPLPNHKSLCHVKIPVEEVRVETTDTSIRFLSVSLAASFASFLQAKVTLSLL